MQTTHTPSDAMRFDEWEARMRSTPGFAYINVNRLTGRYFAIGDLPDYCTCIGTYGGEVQS